MRTIPLSEKLIEVYGSADSMNKSYKMNRGNLNSTHEKKGRSISSFGMSKNFDLEFKDLPPEELEILKETIRFESKLRQRRALITFGILVGIVSCITLLIVL